MEITKQQYRMLSIIKWLSISCVTFYIVDMFYNPDYFWVETRYTRRVLNSLLKKELIMNVSLKFNPCEYKHICAHYIITTLGIKILNGGEYA